MKRLVLSIGMIFLSIPQTRAVEQNKELERFVTALQQSFDQQSASNKNQQSGVPSNQRILLAQLQNAISRGDAAQLETSLLGLAGYIDSDKLQKKYEEILSQLQIDREKREEKSLEEINATLKRAEVTVQTANKTADFDSVLRDLNQLQKIRTPQNSVEVSAALNQVDAAIEFTTQWQNYYSSTAAGHTESARQALESLCNSRTLQLGWIPRSEILSRLNFMINPPMPSNDGSAEVKPAGQLDHPSVEKPLRINPSTGAIEFDAKRLSDLPGIVNALTPMLRNSDFGSYQQFILDSLNVLAPLNKAYLDFQSGLPASVEVAFKESNLGSLQGIVTPLRVELLRLVLPRYLGLASDTVPKSGEVPYEFLGRISTEAIHRGDYPLAARAIEVQRLIKEGTPPDPELKSQAELLVSGDNFSASAQFSLAVVSYEQALASGSNLIPPKIIGEKLEAIKAAHPEEYRQGLELYFTDPQLIRRALPRPRQWRPQQPGMPPFGRPAFGRPPNQQPSPNPSILIPAATPSPTPSPSTTTNK